MGQNLGTLVIPKIGGSNPPSPATGQLFYDTDDNTFRGWNGTAWVDLGALDIDALPAASALLPADLVAASIGGTESKATVEQFGKALWLEDLKTAAKGYWEFWSDTGTTKVGEGLFETNSGDRKAFV